MFPRAFLKVLVVSTIFLSVIIFLIARGPGMHGEYLSEVIGKSVVMLTPVTEFKSGGTGFHLWTQDYGKVVITNAHVCRSILKKSSIFLQNRRLVAAHITKVKLITVIPIIKISETSDLCMLKGIAYLEALTLGHRPELNDEVVIVGHPSLQPLTLTRGTIIGRSLIEVVTASGHKDCEKVNQRKAKVFKTFPVCVSKYMAILSSADAFPGNSGSPVVDWFGNVVAVVFATNSQTHDGIFVDYDDLKNFIKKPIKIIQRSLTKPILYP